MTFSFRIKQFIMFCMVVVTPSCVKYHELIKSEFPQGQDTCDVRDIAHDHVRSTAVYDQFTTLAIFDALWLSPIIKDYYVNAHSKRRGKDDERRRSVEAEFDKDFAECNAFYLLADLRVKTHKGLHEKGSYWTVALENKDGKRVEATSIKSVEISPEYQVLFGHRFNLFKEVYLVKFPANVGGKPFFDNDEPLTMLLSSPCKNVRISWNNSVNQKTKKKKLLKHDNCDWF